MNKNVVRISALKVYLKFDLKVALITLSTHGNFKTFRAKISYNNKTKAN